MRFPAWHAIIRLLILATVALVIPVYSSLAQSAGVYKVNESTYSQIADGNLHGYVGKIALPADGVWQVDTPESESTIRELYLVPSDPSRIRQLGRRMYAAMEERHTANARYQVRMGYEAARTFAQENAGIGPRSISDFEGRKEWDYVRSRWVEGSWYINRLDEVLGKDPPKGPYVHLVPGAKFRFAEPTTSQKPKNGKPVRKSVPTKKREVLAFELQPLTDDGKHWVLFTDGQCERNEIDGPLVRSQGVSIKPMQSKFEMQPGPTQAYTVVCVCEQSRTGALELTASNRILGKTTRLSWSAQSSKTVSYNQVGNEIAKARQFSWQPYLLAGASGILKSWDQSVGVDQARRPRRDLSLFSVLGGRAAIEETLQLQDLNTTATDAEATVDVDSIDGVKVTSHPFKEMLRGEPGGKLEMAEYVPADRLFVYIGKPEKIPALLDSGAPFIATMGTTLTGNSLNYNLEQRYLAKLGMNRDWVDAVLKSGLTSEMAVFAPDLFFIDGTDVTVIARLREPKLLKRLIGMLGVSDLDSDSVIELPTTTGGKSFMALRDDLLLISTVRSELEQSLGLIEQSGDGSLGKSDEFRYMLTQLPVNEETRLYVYLSDPFVRRLVSPRVKIGQRRRTLAKAKMEALTAKSMLAKLDGRLQPTSFHQLTQNEYLPKTWQNEGMLVSANGLVRSERYGTLPEMRTLPEVPLDKVTPEEAKAYEDYRENYSRYWRRFFDPIGIRLDDVGSDELELTTFILPLVDNSIYNGLRRMLVHQDDQTSLAVPIVQPAPVLQFSANLKEEAWQSVAGNFSELFTRYSGASSAMLDDLGPSVHVAVFDADPIIAMGSGDIFGAFGGNVIGGGSDMMMYPVMLSMLTRPCSIFVETKSPQRTAQYLRQAALAGLSNTRRSRDFSASFYQVEDRDEWVWSMNVFGMIKLRYGLEVVDKYLVIRNIPWSSDDRVVSVAPAEMNAAMLRANPAACKQQLPGLFAAASDANRKAAMTGLGRLYPFMLAGAESVEAAATEHQRLFGFYPKASPGDRWRWVDYRLISEKYGEPAQQRQPAFDASEPFGMMGRVDTLQLNMQFESDGLRSSVRWRLR